MPYKGESPNKFLGSIATATLGRKASAGGNFDRAKYEKLAQKGGFFGKIAQSILDKNPVAPNQAAAVAGATPQAPSVVQTAGATNMGQRINTIESRLQALEGSGVSSNPAGDVAPPADANLGGMPQEAAVAAMPTDIPATPQMPGVQEPIIPQSEQLGSLMASPFTMRQRTNMGPLNLNSPLNGNAFAEAVQNAKASGASTFEVGGKTYNVK